MKKAKPWLILTLAFYLLFLFWTLPAQYVWSFLEKRQVIPAGVLAVTGVEGAWTAGRILKIKTGQLELTDLSWRFQPAGLFRGRLQLALSGGVAEGTVSTILRVGLATVGFAHLRGQIPAAALGEKYLPGVEMSGLVEIADLALLAKNGYLIAGSGQLALRNGEVHSPYQMALGGVTVDLSTTNEGVLFKLKDLGGGLQTSGLGTLTAEGRYSFDGTVGARQGSSPELATFLQILGRPRADGMVNIAYKGQIGRIF